jgi:small-conductance mechanosensitive channel
VRREKVAEHSNAGAGSGTEAGGNGFLNEFFGMPLDRWLDLEALQETAQGVQAWFFDEVLALSSLAQLLVIIGGLALSRVLAPLIKKWLNLILDRVRLHGPMDRIGRIASPLAFPIIWLVFQWLAVVIAAQAGWPNHLMRITMSLLAAWVVIRLASQFLRDPVWSKLLAVAAWSMAALNILGLFDAAIDLLDSLALTLGDLRISALTITQGILSLAVLLWLATFLSGIFERRIRAFPSLTPSVQVLFSKLLKIVLITIAIVAALRTVGIDLTAFAVFSGAVGVGIGFGLQKVVSNLISGVILLLDRSVKPGDVITLGDTYGAINTLGARYASVRTRDGTEFLIPNEDLITQQVVNWTHSNNVVRLKIPVGISYNADPHEAIQLCLAAADDVPRVVKDPKPNCLLMGFGNSSVDLELRIWINDPENGVANVKSQTLLKVWDAFKEAGIEIPFPQRDLHIKTAEGLSGVLPGQAAHAQQGSSTAEGESAQEDLFAPGDTILPQDSGGPQDAPGRS